MAYKRRVIEKRSKQKINEIYKVRGIRFNDDLTPIFDALSELSEEYFNDNSKVLGFPILIKILSKPFKPTKIFLGKFNKFCYENLPDKVGMNKAYIMLKQMAVYIENNPDIAYKREFKKYQGNNSLIAEFFSQIKQAVFYYEDMQGNVVDKLIDEYSIDREYAEAVANMMDEQNFSLDDIHSCSERRYGSGVEVEIGNQEWLFLDDTEADMEAERSIQDLIDDVGVTYINGWEDFIDSDFFDDAMEESHRFYAEDIANESSREFENRLVEECYTNGLIDDDDFAKEDEESDAPDYNECLLDENELIDRLVDDMNSRERDSVEWYRINFGDKQLSEMAIQNNAVNMDELIQYVIDSDGRGHILSSYDGNEYDFNNIFYYRTN